LPAQPTSKPSRLVANAHFMWAFCFLMRLRQQIIAFKLLPGIPTDRPFHEQQGASSEHPTGIDSGFCPVRSEVF